MKALLYIFTFILCSSVMGQSLNTIESVEYDHENQRFLVSNSSSIIAMSHPDLELSFFGSGAASFGMEVMNNTLFVIQNGIRAYDLETEEQIMTHTIPGSGFLNGMASDGVSRLWVTDFSNDRIYEIDVTDLGNPTHQIVVNDTESTPNGIVYDEDNDRLIFVSWGANAPIKEVSLPFYGVSVLTETNLGFCDGIDNNNANEYFVSSWSPTRISKFDPAFSETPEIIEAPGIDSPADICYAKEIDTLAIPNSGNSTVTFVGFENTLSLIDSQEIGHFRVIGNPITEQSRFVFELTTTSLVNLRIMDLNGKEVASLISGQRMPGKYSVLLYGVHLSPGIYLAQINIEGKQASTKIVVE